MPKMFRIPILNLELSFHQLIALLLFVSGSVVLIWVGWITWYDMTVWSKPNVGAVFFEDRTGQPTSLGIGMKIVYYFVIGASLLATGSAFYLKKYILGEHTEQSLMLEPIKIESKKVSKKVESPEKLVTTKEEIAAAREERFFSGCLHHFGYLSSRPKDSPIPQECILCQRLGDCMVATVYVQKVSK